MNRELSLHEALVNHEDNGWIFDSDGDGIKILPPPELRDEYGLYEEDGWTVPSVEGALAFIDGFYAARHLEYHKPHKPD
jgi:hypothetical protein